MILKKVTVMNVLKIYDCKNYMGMYFDCDSTMRMKKKCKN